MAANMRPAETHPISISRRVVVVRRANGDVVHGNACALPFEPAGSVVLASAKIPFVRASRHDLNFRRIGMALVERVR